MTMSGSFMRVVFFLIIITALALNYSSAPASAIFKPVFNPSLDIKKLSGNIKIDGHLDEEGWKSASRANNFVERQPGDKTKPEVETEAYITYDDDKLYVAFVCYDDPSSIRATMCQRDQFNGDDMAYITIDTYGDAAWAYEFFVNPYGVQMDYLWSSITGEDRGYDMIWESAAQINQSGYQVEMAIPFASLRFPNNDVQKWKVDFGRNRPRESYYRYNWAAYNRDEQCWPCQWGSVDGIANVRPGKGLEIMPTIIANQSGSLANYDNPDSPFDNKDPDAEVSFGGKYSINSNFTLEASYNPDFSQIESDAAQIDVNTTIALFYPERRPFFQEGSDIFRTIFNAFYTRTVNDPQFAAKLTGRLNRVSIGFLSAYDENSPYMIPLSESGSIVNSGKSLVNVLRASRTFGEDSQLGMFFSDRRFNGGGSGTVAAIDGSIRLADNYRIVGQYITSYTTEQDDSILSEGLEDIEFDDGKYTAAFDGESYSGDAFITQFRRRARHWNFTVDYNQVAPAYRTETGYDPWNDYRHFSTYSGYTIYFDKGIFERITPQMYFESRFKFNNDRRWAYLNMSIDSHLRFAQTYFSALYSRGTETWSGLEYKDLWSIEFDLGSTINDQLGYYIGFDIGHDVAFGPQAVGQETELYAELDLKPTDRFIIEPNVSFLRSTSIETDEEYFEGYITRTRFHYQANKELSVRMVVQYNDFSENWDIDPLLTYRISPFTVFYVGSTHDVTKLNYGPNDPAQWKQTERQFFMKLQYLFRT